MDTAADICPYAVADLLRWSGYWSVVQIIVGKQKKQNKGKSDDTDLSEAADLLLPNRGKVLQSEPVFTERIDELRDANPGLHGDGLVLDVDVQHLVMRARLTMPARVSARPLGDRPEPSGRSLRRSLCAAASASWRTWAESGWGRTGVCTSWVPLQLETAWRSSGSGAYLKGTAFLCSASAGNGKE
jgi:hypothetical protein